jgi:hypothetical protein
MTPCPLFVSGYFGGGLFIEQFIIHCRDPRLRGGDSPAISCTQKKRRPEGRLVVTQCEGSSGVFPLPPSADYAQSEEGKEEGGGLGDGDETELDRSLINERSFAGFIVIRNPDSNRRR